VLSQGYSSPHAFQEPCRAAIAAPADAVGTEVSPPARGNNGINIVLRGREIKPALPLWISGPNYPYSGKALLKCFIIVYCFADIGSHQAAKGMTPGSLPHFTQCRV
jgi:hypothetical protein